MFFLNGDTELYENIDAIHVFKDSNGIEWLAISHYDMKGVFAGQHHKDATHQQQRKSNIPLNQVRTYDVITDVGRPKLSED